jgi:Phage tail tube protein
MATLGAGAQSRLVYIPESTFGLTPATPTMKNLRYNTHTLELTRTNLVSGEIRGDRGVHDFRLGQKDVIGDVVCELNYTDVDPLIELAFCGTWTTEAAGTPNTLKVGSTKRSWTLEAGDLDTSIYRLYKGCFISKMALSIKPAAMVTATFTWMGQDMVDSATTAANGAITASTTNSPMDSFSGSLKEGGSTLGYITGLDITLDNGATAPQVVGANKIPDFFLGRANITGTLSALFPDKTLLDKFIAETETTIDVTLGGLPANKTMEFNLVRVKYTKAAAPISNEAGIIQTLPFQALYLDGNASPITITRSNP